MQPQTVKSMMFTSARKPGTADRDPTDRRSRRFRSFALDQMLEGSRGRGGRSDPNASA